MTPERQGAATACNFRHVVCKHCFGPPSTPVRSTLVRKLTRSHLSVACLLATALAVSACSSSSSSSGGNTGSASASESASSSGSGSPSGSASSTEGGGGTGADQNINNEGTPTKGGTLNMLGTGDVDYMDPNIMYYSGSYLAARLF